MYVANYAYGTKTFSSQIEIRNSASFPLNPRSDVVYFIDGIVDFSDKPINVPSGGLYFSGHGNEKSGIKSTADNYTLFNGVAAGNIFYKSMFIEVSGANSKVYDVISATGFEAIECYEVNFNNCTSLGEVTNYRQFLEDNTGRFGGKPELTLSGSVNGYRITTSIVRNLDSDFSGSLFKAGTGLSFSNRFLTDMNCDLPPNAKVSDFLTSNFQFPSLMQVHSGIFSREGIISTGDNNFFPNLDPDDLVCSWKNNEGLRNTFEGGRITLSSEVTTTVSQANTFYALLGVWTAEDLQHFSSPSNGKLQNDGTNPTQFSLSSSLTVQGTANNVIEVRVRKWDSISGTFVTAYSQKSTINSLSGPRDVAFIVINRNLEIKQNDYIFLEIANLSESSDLTLEVDSFIQVNAR